jgi:hypothetical protein
MKSKLVLGVGLYERGKYQGYIGTRPNQVRSKEYALWSAMLTRCYSTRARVHRPTYDGCEVSDNFKNFQYFAEWCNNQIGFGNEGWHLDKDLLGSGKLYSEDICCFIPSRVNTVILDRGSDRGEFPLGVHFCRHNRAFIVQCCDVIGRKKLGQFACPQKAFEVYLEFKKGVLKCLADTYKDQIRVEVYNALINYKVDDRYAITKNNR